MTKTLMQLPPPSYQEVQRVAHELDWSLAAEVLRRGADYVVRCYLTPLHHEATESATRDCCDQSGENTIGSSQSPATG